MSKLIKLAPPIPEINLSVKFSKPWIFSHYEVFDISNSNLLARAFNLNELRNKCAAETICPIDCIVFSVYNHSKDNINFFSRLNLSDYAFKSIVVDKIGCFDIFRDAWSWTDEGDERELPMDNWNKNRFSLKRYFIKSLYSLIFRDYIHYK